MKTVNEDELWMPIIGYENRYSISSIGRLKSFRGKYNQIEKILKYRYTYDGYINYLLTKNNIGKNCLAHRLVANHFLVNTNTLAEVNHKDGVKINNDFKNLEWCTHKQNMEHAGKNNLMPRFIGELNVKSKLSSNDVLQIRSKNYTHLSLRQIAEVFNVYKSTIHKILKYKTWKHIA